MRASDNPVVERHYAAQKTIARRTARDVTALGGTTRRDLAAAALIVHDHSQAAVAVAVDYYADLRDQAGIGGRFNQPVTTTRTADQALAYLTASSVDVPEAAALALVAEVSDFLVAEAGRGQVIAAAKADTKATRWARVASTTACAFCTMLATRGAAYRTEETGSFEAHRGCHCTVQPVFGPARSYEPPAHIRQAQTLWSESTDGVADKANAFRRAFERGT